MIAAQCTAVAAAPDLHLTPRGVRRERRAGRFQSETRRFFDDLIQLAVAVRRFRPRASFEADRGFDEGNSAEREKRNMLFPVSPLLSCEIVTPRPLPAPIAVAQQKCSIVKNEHAHPTCTSGGSKRKRAQGRKDRSEPCRRST